MASETAEMEKHLGIVKLEVGTWENDFAFEKLKHMKTYRIFSLYVWNFRLIQQFFDFWENMNIILKTFERNIRFPVVFSWFWLRVLELDEERVKIKLNWTDDSKMS